MLSQQSGISIGLPPVINFGSKHLKEKIVRDVVTGEKSICLAISEPTAGSDVASIKTTAKREGDFYIVSGQKKWITSGLKSDYITAAVRTGEEGMMGISLLVIDSKAPGVKLRKMET